MAKLLHAPLHISDWLSLSFLPVVSAQCWPNRSNLGFRVLHMNGWTHGLQEQYVKETQILVKHQTEDKWAFVENNFSLFPKRRTYLPSCRNVYYPLYTYVVTDVCNTHISYSICCVMDLQPGLRRKHQSLNKGKSDGGAISVALTISMCRNLRLNQQSVCQIQRIEERGTRGRKRKTTRT